MSGVSISLETKESGSKRTNPEVKEMANLSNNEIKSKNKWKTPVLVVAAYLAAFVTIFLFLGQFTELLYVGFTALAFFMFLVVSAVMLYMVLQQFRILTRSRAPSKTPQQTN